MLTVPDPAPELVERFLSYVEVGANDCQVWGGHIDRHGYAEFVVQRRKHLAHRVAFAWWVEPLVDGLVIDHLCRTRSCVNPEHLEQVTNGENLRRQHLRGTCRRGHPYAGDSYYVRRDGRRICRVCQRAAVRRYRARLAS